MIEEPPDTQSTQTDPVTIQLKDPVVGAYLFVEKHEPAEVENDPRRDLIDLLIRAKDKLSLDETGTSRYASPLGIDLSEVDRSEPLYEPVINLFHHSADLSRQALAFTFLDTLGVQVFASRIGVFSLAEVQTEVLQFLNETIGANLFSSGAREGGWGGKLFVCGMVPRETNFHAAFSNTLSAFAGAPETVARVEHGVFASISIGGLEGLLLLSQDSPESENWAQRMLIEHTSSAPAPLLLLELARSKFDYEHRQYREVKLILDKLSKEIDHRLDWLINAQRANDQRLGIVGSRESIELLEKLSSATTDYADFRRAVTRVGELRNTLRINFENYRSILKDVMPDGNSDRLFTVRLHQMEQIQAQLDFDSVYSDAVLERSQTILETAAMRVDLLRGAQEREEISLQGIQTGALTAITVGLAMLQIFGTLKDLHLTTPVIWMLTVTLMAGTFALAQVVINWKRVKTPIDRISVAATVGLMCALVLTIAFMRRGTFWSVALTVLVFAVGTFAGYRLFLFYEAKQLRK